MLATIVIYKYQNYSPIATESLQLLLYFQLNPVFVLHWTPTLHSVATCLIVTCWLKEMIIPWHLLT